MDRPTTRGSAVDGGGSGVDDVDARGRRGDRGGREKPERRLSDERIERAARVDRLAARELTPAGECPVAVAGRDLENLSRAHLFRRGAANIERPDAVGAGASGRIYPT